MSRTLFTRTVCTAALAISLAGCTATGGLNKEALGTGVGVLLGAATGAALGGDNAALAALGGAALGGLIGNQIGAYLDEDEQQDLSNVSQKTLSTTPDGTPTQWKSPTSDSIATVTPTNTRIETKPMPMTLSRQVAPPAKLKLIGKDLVATANVNIRTSPTKNSKVVTGLAAGQSIHAVGEVDGEPWIMVARGGKSIGYVHKDYLATQAAYDATKKSQTTTASTKAPASPPAEVIATDATKQQTIDLDAQEADDLVVTKVSVITQCRDLTTKVTTTDGNAEEKTTACKNASGTWEL